MLPDPYIFPVSYYVTKPSQQRDACFPCTQIGGKTYCRYGKCSPSVDRNSHESHSTTTATPIQVECQVYSEACSFTVVLSVSTFHVFLCVCVFLCVLQCEKVTGIRVCSTFFTAVDLFDQRSTFYAAMLLKILLVLLSTGKSSSEATIKQHI